MRNHDGAHPAFTVPIPPRPSQGSRGIFVGLKFPFDPLLPRSQHPRVTWVLIAVSSRPSRSFNAYLTVIPLSVGDLSPPPSTPGSERRSHAGAADKVLGDAVVSGVDAKRMEGAPSWPVGRWKPCVCNRTASHPFTDSPFLGKKHGGIQQLVQDHRAGFGGGDVAEH